MRPARVSRSGSVVFGGGSGGVNGMKKSTRHSKITGDFAEALVLYWLSKSLSHKG
jgi:hypothetical protein